MIVIITTSTTVDPLRFCLLCSSLNDKIIIRLTKVDSDEWNAILQKC